MFMWVICFTTALFGGVTAVYAQTHCAFDKANASLKKHYPSVAQNIADNDTRLKQIIAQQRKQAPQTNREIVVYTIPVVVHILHTGGDIGTIYNPDNQQILDAINYLNDVYSGKNSSLTPAGVDAAGDIGIKFVLAQRDPQCNPTNGIHRVDMSENPNYLVYGATYDDVAADIALKAPIIWDKSRYYNIYVVNKINGFDGSSFPDVSAYAYLPTNSVVDGTVILSSNMKWGSNTLVHEIGHAFNLYHPFEGSSVNTQCPVGDGDMVDDTDPISYNIDANGTVSFMCRTGRNACNNNLPYSIRTEQNFMNYTACNTLFTPGQKERMRASLLLDDRKTLITSTAFLPTHLNPVCSPKINFENDYTELERISTSTVDCRRYKDYTVYLNISSKPSNNVNVDVQVDPASDAVENIDYSFPNGKTIAFPAGSYNIQPIKVRVYSDADYPQSRTLKLGFAIKQGSSAEKGTACTTMYIRVLPRNDKPIPPGSVVRSQIGKYDENINDIRIFNGLVQNQKTQILYRADELKRIGVESENITGLSFFLIKKTTRPFRNISIRLAHTKYTSLVDNGNINRVSGAMPVAAFTSFTTVYGWNYFKFNNPFKWNGVDNIVVEICIDNAGETAFEVDDIYSYTDTGNVEKGNTMFSDEGCEKELSAISYYSKGIRPIIKIDHVKAGNLVRDAVGISQNFYLGPYAEAFFYDQSSPQKIIARVKNLSSWNYGCTNIKIDRAGNNTSPFLSYTESEFLAQKTFIITPERNNAQGRYELTLYYTNDEKVGYEKATGKSWQNIQIIKSNVPINSITPASPQPDKIEKVPINNFGTYGTAYALTASFNSQLSAYGIGFVNNIALPVEWGNVQAKVVGENVLVKWETYTETNNNYFEIEASGDGVHFTTIGNVKGKGNSNIISVYEFLHANPTVTGRIYYRIKQVDIDGKQSYSNPVYVNFQKTSISKPFIYPVPANNIITVNFGKEVLQPLVEIYSVDMKLLSTHKKNGRSSAESINIQHLVPGAYIARLSFNGEQHSIRFVKF